MAERWVEVSCLDDLPVGEMVAVEADGHAIALYRLADGEVRATDNICTHALAYLTDGWLEDGEVECPLHGGRFDVRTGAGLCAPIEEPLRTYDVRIEAGRILLALSSRAADG